MVGAMTVQRQRQRQSATMKTNKRALTKRPKKRRSAYIYFVKEYRESLRKQNPNLTFAECSKLCAAKWKHMNESKKEKYKKMSEKDAVRYRAQMKALTPKQLKMTKKRKDPKAPVRPLSAYLWFCRLKWREMSKQMPRKATADTMKHLARMWSESTEDARKEFEEYAECDRKCYQVEMQKYRRKLRK